MERSTFQDTTRTVSLLLANTTTMTTTQTTNNHNSTTPWQSSSSRRYVSQWIVPKSIDIPQEDIDISFARSSGAGGQNVNKVNTKVEIRFHVDTAKWIPDEVKQRLKEQQGNRINKDGYLTLASQDYRTQGQNRKAVLGRLEAMILEAYPRPKIRKQRQGISQAAKERNKQDKRRRSEVKSSRRNIDF